MLVYKFGYLMICANRCQWKNLTQSGLNHCVIPKILKNVKSIYFV